MTFDEDNYVPPIDRRGSHYNYPFSDLPSWECHIAPPYAAINAGHKLDSANLQGVVDKCGGSDAYRADLTECLLLLQEIWELFKKAMDDAEG